MVANNLIDPPAKTELRPTGTESPDSDGAQIQRLRHDITQTLQASVLNPKSAMSLTDLEDFMEMGTSPEALDRAQKLENKNPVEALTEMKRCAERFAQQADGLGASITGTLENARKKNLISSSTLHKLTGYLKTWSGRGQWSAAQIQLKSFLDSKLPSMMETWKEMATKREDLKEKMAKLNLDPSDLPETQKLFGQEYTDAGVRERQTIIDAAAAKLAVFGDKRRERLYAQSKEQLEEAVALHILSPRGVQKWLRRIFESGARLQLIEDFVTGKGTMPLRKLIQNWQAAKDQFMDIERERERRGTPRHFHFVKLEVFLEWDYTKRTSYNEAAKGSMETILDTHPILLDIRHDIAEGDWASAEYDLTRARDVQFSKKDKEQFRSLLYYVRTHRPSPENWEKREGQATTKEEIALEAEAIFRQEVASGAQQFYRDLFYRENFQTLRTGLDTVWNIEWATRNQYLNPEILEQLRESAPGQTQRIQKHGHTRKIESVDTSVVDSSAKQFVTRDHEDDTRAPTYIHLHPAEFDSFRKTLREEQNNYWFKYWVLTDIVSAPYEQTLYCCRYVHNRLKSLKRRYDAAPGKLATPDVRSADSAHKQARQGIEDRMTHIAMAP